MIKKDIKLNYIKSIKKYQTGDKIKLLRDEHPVLDFIAGFIPGVGQAQSVQDFSYAAKDKNYLGMGLAALGFVPIVGGIGKTGRLLSKVDDLTEVGAKAIKKVENAITELKIPKDYSLIKEVQLRTKDGVRTVHLIKNNKTGKFAILEDLDLNHIATTSEKLPKVDLNNYHGEKLTGLEPGFDNWALSRVPENDHFPDLSHGLNDIRDLLPIMRREFEALPNGSKLDLGNIFSSDSSSNLLLFIRRNNKRIKLVLPRNPDEVVRTNNHGIRGKDSERIFNLQLDELLDTYGLSPTSVPKAVYDYSTNTLSVPKLSFLKLYKKGNKLNGNKF